MCLKEKSYSSVSENGEGNNKRVMTPQERSLRVAGGSGRKPGWGDSASTVHSESDSGSFDAESRGRSQKYKTEICKNFEATRTCKWGAACCFAHGKSELRGRGSLNLAYKTKICKHFHRGGLCPYGYRCQYFHFKNNQIFQEIVESLEDKLTPAIESFGGGLTEALGELEPLCTRLAVFDRLSPQNLPKSLLQKFLEHSF